MSDKKLSTEMKKKIIEKYVNTYTTTSFWDRLTIYQLIDDMVVNDDNLTMDDIDEIIKKIHKKLCNDSNLYSSIIDWVCSNTTLSFEDEDCDKKQDSEKSDNADKSKLSEYTKCILNIIDDIYDDKSEDEKVKKDEPLDVKPAFGSKAYVKPMCNCMYRQNEKIYSDDTKNYKEIKISVPGVLRGNISLTIKNNILTMQLKNVIRENDFVDKDMKLEYLMKPNYDVEHINSKLENGILTIHIPKIIPLNTDKTIEIK